MNKIFMVAITLLAFNLISFGQQITIENGTGFNKIVNLQIRNQGHISNDYVIKKVKIIMNDLMNQYSCTDLKNGQKIWVDVRCESVVLDSMRLISETAMLNIIPNIELSYDYKEYDKIINGNVTPYIYEYNNIEIDYFDTIHTRIEPYTQFKVLKTYKNTVSWMIIVNDIKVFINIKFGYLCNNIWHDYTHEYEITPINNLKRLSIERKKLIREFKTTEKYGKKINHIYFQIDSVKNKNDINSILPIIKEKRIEARTLFVSDSLLENRRTQIFLMEQHRIDSTNAIINHINDSLKELKINQNYDKLYKNNNNRNTYYGELIYLSILGICGLGYLLGLN